MDCRWPCCLLLAVVPWVDSLHAQLSPEKMAAEAEGRILAGDPKKAVELYENLLSQYPAFLGGGPIRYQLALAHYLAGFHDKAAQKFRELAADKKLLQGFRELAILNMAEVQATMATGQLKMEDRSRFLRESIQSYDIFIKNFPESQFRNNALYGKAAAQWQANQLELAVKTLNEFLNSAASSHLKGDALYLRARVYVDEAKSLQNARKEAEARKHFDEARKLFDQIAEASPDPILASEALISTGQMLIHMKAWSEAIAFLRRVKSRGWIEDQQRKLVEENRAARVRILSTGNQRALGELDHQYERFIKRLTMTLNQPSLFLGAQQLISQCFYEQKKYDEALILNRHFLPHFDANQRSVAQYVMIKALIEKKEPERAVQTYRELKSVYPRDKGLENIPIMLAEYFQANSQYDDSIKWAEEYKTTYPNGAHEDAVCFLIGNAHTITGRLKEAEGVYADFIKRFPKSSLLGSVTFNKAYVSYLKKDYRRALDELNNYSQRFTDDINNRENALFLAGMASCETGQFDGAIAKLQEFEKRYPKSKQLPEALYKTAQAYEAKKDFAGSNTVYAQVLKNFPKDELAPYCQFGIARNLTSLGPARSQEATSAFDQFLKLFPTHTLVSHASLLKAEILRNAQKFAEAEAAYRELIAKSPGSDGAIEAHAAMGEMFFQQARNLAEKPEKLTPEKQEEWKKFSQKSQTAYEEALKKSAKEPVVDKVLSQLAMIWQIRIHAKFATGTEARAWFDGLSVSFPANSELQVKIQFALGSLLSVLNDHENALDVFSRAYGRAKGVSIPNECYRQFRDELIASRQYDKAIEVSEKHLAEKQAVDDAHGMAEASLGLGRAWFEKDNPDKAAGYLKEVTVKYPWHETAAPEAEYYQIWIDEKNRSFDSAIQRYTTLLSKTESPELKARVGIRLGYTWLGKAEAFTENKTENLKESLGYFLKIGTSYTAFPAHASEGLFMASSVYEKFATIAADPKTRTEAVPNAVRYYKRCAEEYPNLPWGLKAKERVKVLDK